MKRLAFSVVTGAGEHRPLQRSPGTGTAGTALQARKSQCFSDVKQEH